MCCNLYGHPAENILQSPDSLSIHFHLTHFDTSKTRGIYCSLKHQLKIEDLPFDKPERVTSHWKAIIFSSHQLSFVKVFNKLTRFMNLNSVAICNLNPKSNLDVIDGIANRCIYIYVYIIGEPLILVAWIQQLFSRSQFLHTSNVNATTLSTLHS